MLRDVKGLLMHNIVLFLFALYLRLCGDYGANGLHSNLLIMFSFLVMCEVGVSVSGSW